MASLVNNSSLFPLLRGPVESKKPSSLGVIQSKTHCSILERGEGIIAATELKFAQLRDLAVQEAKAGAAKELAYQLELCRAQAAKETILQVEQSLKLAKNKYSKRAERESKRRDRQQQDAEQAARESARLVVIQEQEEKYRYVEENLQREVSLARQDERAKVLKEEGIKTLDMLSAQAKTFEERLIVSVEKAVESNTEVLRRPLNNPELEIYIQRIDALEKELQESETERKGLMVKLAQEQELSQKAIMAFEELKLDYKKTLDVVMPGSGQWLL